MPPAHKRLGPRSSPTSVTTKAVGERALCSPFPKAGPFPSSFCPEKASVLWVLLLLFAFHPTAHGQVLQDAPFPTPGVHYQMDSVCARKGVSSVLILREDNEEGPRMCYKEYDRHGRILKGLDQDGSQFHTYLYPSQGKVLELGYRLKKNQKYEEGWHLNFPENFNQVSLCRYDVDEKGNWYRISAADIPIAADTNFQVMYERTICYAKDSIITFEPGIIKTCWNRRSVFEPDGKLRSALLLPADGACYERIYCDSMVYKSAPHTWTIIRPSFYQLDVEVKVRDDGQPKKYVEISSNGKRALSQKNFFSEDGRIIQSSFHNDGHQVGTTTYTYNEKGLLSESLYVNVAGRRISTRYQYAFF